MENNGEFYVMNENGVPPRDVLIISIFIKVGALLQDSVYHPSLQFDNGISVPVTGTPAERWAQYCDLMKRPHEWGDETCLTAACNFSPPTHYTPSDPDCIVGGVEIFLGHICECHYVCLALGMLHYINLSL